MTSATSLTYSYSPKALVSSHRRMKEKVRECLRKDSLQKNYVTENAGGRENANEEGDDTFALAVVQITGAGVRESEVEGYWDRIEGGIAAAARDHNADVVLLPELITGPYFCQTQEYPLMDLADPLYGGKDDCENDDEKRTVDGEEGEHVLVRKVKSLAKRYGVVIPVSFYERCNNALYNSIVVIDSDGTNVGSPYRKSHIPDGPGYCEKFYFSPGDTGFRVFACHRRRGVTQTTIRVGVAICWDQWFPEAARSMSLLGADVLLYPTAIGSEPHDVNLQSSAHWQRVMQGHAAANMVPVAAANRYGTEILLREPEQQRDGGDQQQQQNHNENNDDRRIRERQRIHFYGKSFITDNTGAIVQECPDNYTQRQGQQQEQDDGGNETDEVTGKKYRGFVIVSSTINPVQNRQDRLSWGLFRDRRPELYGTILTKDGKTTTNK